MNLLSVLEWAGGISLVILLCYSAYPGKVEKLERKLKKLEHNQKVERLESQLKKLGRNQKGEIIMSKIISELVGKTCIIKTDEALSLIGAQTLKCNVLDADDEWIKFTYTDRKQNTKTKILRIDSIDDIELIDE